MKKTAILLGIISNISFSFCQTKVPFLKKNGKYIYVDSATMKPLSEKEYSAMGFTLPKIILKNGKDFDWEQENNLDHSDSSIIQFEKDGLNGYKNNIGNVIINPVYNVAERFNDGLAYVRNDDTEQMGFINKYGKFIIKNVNYNYTDFRKGIACVSIKDSLVYNDVCHTEVDIVINTKGDRVLDILSDPCADDNSKIDYSKMKPKGKYILYKGYGINGGYHGYKISQDGTIGILLVKGQDNYVSYFNTYGKIIIEPFMAPAIGNFINGFAKMILYVLGTNNQMNSYQYFIDKKGRQFYEK